VLPQNPSWNKGILLLREGGGSGKGDGRAHDGKGREGVEKKGGREGIGREGGEGRERGMGREGGERREEGEGKRLREKKKGRVRGDSPYQSQFDSGTTGHTTCTVGHGLQFGSFTV